MCILLHIHLLRCMKHRKRLHTNLVWCGAKPDPVCYAAQILTSHVHTWHEGMTIYKMLFIYVHTTCSILYTTYICTCLRNYTYLYIYIYIHICLCVYTRVHRMIRLKPCWSRKSVGLAGANPLRAAILDGWEHMMRADSYRASGARDTSCAFLRFHCLASSRMHCVSIPHSVSVRYLRCTRRVVTSRCKWHKAWLRCPHIGTCSARD